MKQEEIQERTYTLYKLPEGFIITSDEKPIKGDLCFDLEGNPGHKNQLYIVKCLRTSDDSYWVKHSKKLIAQQDQIDFSNLTEEEQEEIGWIDLKPESIPFPNSSDMRDGKEIKTWMNGWEQGHIEGFQKSQELLSDRVFTLEEMRKALLEVSLWGNVRSTRFEDVEKIIQSLSQQSWNIEIETECSVCGLTGVHKMSCKTPSLRTQQPRFNNGKIKITKVL